MKCSNCNTEWSAPQNIAVGLSICPFCGADLQPAAPKVLNTAEDVLTEIVSRFGVDTLQNGQRTVALFADLSPALRHERVLLSYLIQSEGNLQLLSVRNKEGIEQQACFRKVCRYLEEELFIAPEAAQKICASFSKAIGLTVRIEKAETIAPAPAIQAPVAAQPPVEKPAPKPVPKPIPKASPVKPAVAPVSSNILSFGQYKTALENYYISLGSVPLTEDQIRQFIRSNGLDKKWGITVPDVQLDLKDIIVKHNPKSASKSISPINSYAQYLQALEKYYIQLEKQPLTNDQIIQFIHDHGLYKSRGITIQDVQKDLKTIYAKHGPNPGDGKIRSYDQYMKALETAYLQNGKKMLSYFQIMDFLKAHDLMKNFKISVSDVQKDLETISRKYS